MGTNKLRPGTVEHFENVHTWIPPSVNEFTKSVKKILYLLIFYNTNYRKSELISKYDTKSLIILAIV